MTEPDLPAAGLTAAKAERRLAPVRTQRSRASDAAFAPGRSSLQFANPLVAILLLASIASAFVGELVHAAIIVVIVSLSVAINSVQTFRSQRAAERLRAAVAPTATVLRDGALVDGPRVDVVPGDLFASAQATSSPPRRALLEVKNLHVQESALTGKSMPVEKAFKPDDETAATMVLLGPSVVSGSSC